MDKFYKFLLGKSTKQTLNSPSSSKSCTQRNSEKAVGIDLGTTYSCVGIWSSGNDRVDIIENEQGNRTTPSMVAFNEHERLIGQSAMNQLSSNPVNTVFDAKRLIGRRYLDPIVQSDKGLWPFPVIRGPNNKPLIQVTFKNEEKTLMAEEISSIVLGKMKDIAEDYLGCKVGKAVITVPAYFNNTQRQATTDAGKIAGLEVLKLLNEPTAAAIAYLSNKQESEYSEKGENVVVYDLGGGTFDVALLHVKSKNDVVVKAVKGDTHLGGQDFDNRLLNHFVQEFKRKSKVDISCNSKALRRLKSVCERAKRELSSNVIAVVEVPAIHEGKDLFSKITRAKFEQINEDLFEQTIEHVEECLKDAQIEKEDVDSVVLVGGSSRIPKVQELVKDFFDTETKIRKNINPDEAVAYGAAVMAADLDGERVTVKIKDVTPLSLGIRVKGNIMSTIIPRNTPVPVIMNENYYTTEDNQTRIAIDVYEGERANVGDNLFLNSFTFEGLPKAEKGVEGVTVFMEIDNSGILTVTATHWATGKKESLRVTAQYGGLMDDEIADMIEAAKRLKIEDEKWKEATVLRNYIEDAIYDAQKQLKQQKGTVSIAEINNFRHFLMKTEEWLSDNENADKEELHDKLEEIVKVCESIMPQKV